jgi:ferredoxin
MKVVTDLGKCCGAGQCVSVAPDVFDQSDETGLVELLEPEPGPDDRESVLAASDVCPSRAITVLEDS